VIPDIISDDELDDFKMFEWTEHDLPESMDDVPEDEIDEVLLNSNIGYRKKPEDTSHLGHTLWREQRRKLMYLRLIEHELPKLVGTFCKYFVMFVVELTFALQHFGSPSCRPLPPPRLLFGL
jgi:hypothetical protein